MRLLLFYLLWSSESVAFVCRKTESVWIKDQWCFVGMQMLYSGCAVSHKHMVSLSHCTDDVHRLSDCRQTHLCCCLQERTKITEHAHKAGGCFLPNTHTSYLLHHHSQTVLIRLFSSMVFFFGCDSAAGPVWDQKEGGHLETDRITDWHTASWVNFSLPLTLSFRKKREQISTRGVV